MPVDNDYSSVEKILPYYINAIPLPLSFNGKLSFALFPESIINYSLDRLKKVSRQSKLDSEQQARYLYGMCNSYAKEQKLSLHYSWIIELKAKCNIPLDAPFTQHSSQETMSEAQEFANSSFKKTHKKGMHQPFNNSNIMRKKLLSFKPDYDREDPIIAYAKIHSWKQSPNYKYICSKIGPVEPPFKKPKNINDEDGYNYVEQWKCSQEGKQWLEKQHLKGYALAIVNLYPNPNQQNSI